MMRRRNKKEQLSQMTFTLDVDIAVKNDREGLPAFGKREGIPYVNIGNPYYTVFIV